MLFSEYDRYQYAKSPLVEVVCQLRFPTILSINNMEPADFQDTIRETFPQYARRQEVPPAVPGTQAQPVANYHFLSEDGRWKLNLTKDFIALSTLRYPGWEEFAHHLDKPLAAFIQLYKPAYFQRVGLRYVNVFSRTRLGLEGTPWRELFAPVYTGPLQEEPEDRLQGWGCDMTLQLDSSCRAKVHAGLGRLQVKNAPQQDQEAKFILDLDLSMGGNLPCTMAAGALETLHIHGGHLFEGAITDRLREALEPTAPQ